MRNPSLVWAIRDEGQGRGSVSAKLDGRLASSNFPLTSYSLYNSLKTWICLKPSQLVPFAGSYFQHTSEDNTEKAQMNELKMMFKALSCFCSTGWFLLHAASAVLPLHPLVLTARPIAQKDQNESATSGRKTRCGPGWFTDSSVWQPGSKQPTAPWHVSTEAKNVSKQMMPTIRKAMKQIQLVLTSFGRGAG